MSVSATALPRASSALMFRLHATHSASMMRPSQQLLRQFSQSWSTNAAAESSAASPYQSYTLHPASSSRSRSEPLTETPIASPVPKVHDTRPPEQLKSGSTQPQIQPQAQTQAASQTGTQTQTQTQTSSTPLPEKETQKSKPAAPKRKLRPRKAAMKLTPTAVEQLRALLNQPDPKLIKVGVRNRGCSGLAYHLEYVDKAGTFDETVEQDGVKVLIDSKALFSIIGSEMDWVEDKLNQRFVFRNPNIKEECGCGESFMV